MTVMVEIEVEVDAAPEDVWAVLASPQQWPAWTASMDSVELLDGNLRTGARVRISQPKLPSMVWTVSDLDPGRAFSWSASSGGVTTIATHTVVALDGGRRSRLALGLTQSGILAPLVGLLLGRRTRAYVGLEAAGLKAAAEERGRRADQAPGE